MAFSTQRLVALIRAEAEEVRVQGQERIRLAAFLFAGCRRLVEEDRSAETGFALRQEQWQLEEALCHLADLDFRLSPGELFGKLLAGLLAIDQSFRPDQEHPHPYHPSLAEDSTRLDSPGDPDPVLRGVVLHWVNMPSVIRQVRKTGRKKKGPREFLDPVTQNLEHLTLYLSEKSKPLPRSLRHDLAPRRTQLERSGILIHKGDFRISFCPLIGCWHPVFEIPEGVEPLSFRAIGENSIVHSEELEQHLRDLVQRAIAEDIRVLVFPELSLDEPRRTLLETELKRQRSKLLSIVAGSFHTQDRPKPFNESLTLDAGGFSYWRQRKNSRYSVPLGTVLDGFFPQQIGMELKEELPEYIRYGEDLYFLDTPIGRLVIIICTDALDRHGSSYLPLILALRPEMVIVLSMSEVTRDFSNFSTDMMRHGISVAFINAACVCKPGGVDLVLFNLAIRKLPKAPPTRWRWVAGKDPEWYDNSRKEWVSLDPDEEESRSRGVWRLRQKNGEIYGIVFDLALLLAYLLETRANS